MTALFMTVAITMAISFLCSLLEACLLSLSLADIGRISERRPPVAAIWKAFKESIERPIAVILIINTLAHTIGASLSGAQFEEIFGPGWIVAFSLAFSLAMIQWTEILPKTLGVRYNKQIAVIAAVPLRYLVAVFRPFVKLVHMLNRPFESRTKQRAQTNAADDISVLARFAGLNNIINRDQEMIVDRTMKLSQLTAKDLMVGRDDIKYLSSDMSMTEALIEAHIHHHTRFPLIEGKNRDGIIGYVNFKDIVSALQTNPKDPSLRGISRPALETREDEPVSLLLGKLRRSYQHMAIVRDARNRVSGIVTLEDVIEALMGDIEDEYDMLPSHLYQIAPGRYIAGGGISVSALRKGALRDLPDTDKTLSQWIAGLAGPSPKAEDRVSYKDYVFILRKIRRSKVYEAIIEAGQTEKR